MTTQGTSTSYLQLSWSEKDRKVVITPEDEDRFVVTVEAAIRACDAAVGFSEFQKQFKALLNKLPRWIKANEGKTSKAYLTVRDAGLLFLVVCKARTHDRAFEDALTELDMQIAQDKDLSLIKLSVLAIPKCSEDSVASFLEPGDTLVYHHAR